MKAAEEKGKTLPPPFSLGLMRRQGKPTWNAAVGKDFDQKRDHCDSEGHTDSSRFTYLLFWELTARVKL